MSSSFMAVDRRESRCLFCSACCGVGVRLGPAATSQPDYPPTGDGRFGICGRGHYLVELLSHPQRLTGATIGPTGSQDMAQTNEGIRVVSKRLKELGLGSHIGVLVDGNLPCEVLAGLSKFTKQVLKSDNFSIYIPPVDQAILEGIAASQAASFGLTDFAACDVMLAVGDPFSMIPVIARAVEDARNSQRGNRLIVIDPLLGRTAKYATDHLAVKPGTEALALATLANESGAAGELASALKNRTADSVADSVGIPADALSAAARAIKGSKKLAIIIGLAEGATDRPRDIALIAAAMAEAKNGGVLPAVSYGNAVGAFRVAQSVGSVPPGKLLKDAESGTLKALIVFGKDLLQDFAGNEWARALKNLHFLAAALPIPGKISRIAHVTLPLALWFEDEGTVIDFSGTRSEIVSLMEPPGNSATAIGLAEAIAAEVAPGSALAVEVTAEDLMARKSGDPAKMLGDLDPVNAPPADGKYVLLSCPSTMNSYDGWLTLACTWGALADGRPLARMNPEDLAQGGLANVDTFTVACDRGKLELIAKADDGVPRGAIAVPCHIAARSGLIAQGVDQDSGALLTGPVMVEIAQKAKAE